VGVYFCKSKAALLFNKRPEELIGKSIFPEAIRTPFHKAYYNMMKTKEIIIEDYFTPWKRWFENRVIPSKEASCFIQDITERKLAEKDCKELNTKLEIRNRELYDSIIHIQKINTN
jgi:hypothetical protein